MTKEREREYARRRYAKWQTKQEERWQQQRVNRRNSILAALAILGVVIAVILVSRQGNDAVTTETPANSAAAASNPLAPKPSSSKYPKAPPATLAAGAPWTWQLTTSQGELAIELDGKASPRAVSNIIFLTQQKYFDKTPCHRLTTQGIFVLQCGDPTASGTGTPGYTFGPVEKFPADGVYQTGVVAMARGQAENSMGSQFFIVYKPSTLTDQAGKPLKYTVIGKVTSGLDVVTKVAGGGVQQGAATAGDGPPKTPISITAATVAKK